MTLQNGNGNENGNGVSNSIPSADIADIMLGQISHALEQTITASRQAVEESEQQKKLLLQRVKNQKRIQKNQVILGKKQDIVISNSDNVLQEMRRMRAEIGQLRTDHKIILELFRYFLAEVSQIPENNARKKKLFEKLEQQKSDSKKSLEQQISVNMNVGGIDRPIQEINAKRNIDLKEFKKTTTIVEEK